MRFRKHSAVTPVQHDTDLLAHMSPEEYAAAEKNLVCKIDPRLMPCLFLIIIMNPYFPGTLFLLSSWYTRKELALRTSILYAGSPLSGGFGGLVGAGVQYGLNGVHGLSSWRWLFIIEASVTVFLEICAMFILPDYPNNTRNFSAEERAIAIRLMHVVGQADEERGSLLAGIRMAVTDYKTWLLALIIITKTSAGAVTSFIPTLMATSGYSKVEALLLVAPLYVFAILVALTISFTSDKLGERAYHIVVPIFATMAGYIIAASSLTLGARYLGIFLALGGVYGSYNVALASISSTVTMLFLISQNGEAAARVGGQVGEGTPKNPFAGLCYSTSCRNLHSGTPAAVPLTDKLATCTNDLLHGGGGCACVMAAALMASEVYRRVAMIRGVYHDRDPAARSRLNITETLNSKTPKYRLHYHKSKTSTRMTNTKPASGAVTPCNLGIDFKPACAGNAGYAFINTLTPIDELEDRNSMNTLLWNCAQIFDLPTVVLAISLGLLFCEIETSNGGQLLGHQLRGTLVKPIVLNTLGLILPPEVVSVFLTTSPARPSTKMQKRTFTIEDVGPKV
ncbi:MFS general substrate transporter [Pleomassaria siparia CBS 279.74]|uniref:MFS general substrate transporter n=1 Tax=Pleomassaria siparia CBS 279.74 TaxID=1314801 RepID=A0A6G1K921_9PLEO|nr:MFS general substrate transporter [Pleomassaria siparia CBS 279.74]